MNKSFSYDNIRAPVYSGLEEAIMDQNEDSFFDSNPEECPSLQTDEARCRTPLKQIQPIKQTNSQKKKPIVRDSPERLRVKKPIFKHTPRKPLLGTLPKALNKETSASPSQDLNTRTSSLTSMILASSAVAKEMRKACKAEKGEIVEKKAKIPSGVPFYRSVNKKSKFLVLGSDNLN